MARPNRLNLVAWAFWALAIAVALLPIGLGGDRPIPLGLAQIGLAFSCLFLASSHDIWIRVRFFRRLHWVFILFGIAIVWAFFQVQPLVPFNWVHPLWQEAAEALKTPVHGTIAIAPEDAMKGIARLVTYIAAGLLAYILSQDAERAKKLLQIIWLSGAAICTYGMIIYLSEWNKILWFDKWAYMGDLTATFVNRNHFALYAGMILVTGAALLTQSWNENVERKKPHQRMAALREWMTKEGIPQSFLLAIVFLSIVFSHSRAGVMVTLIGLGGYFFFYLIYLKAWRRAIVVGGFAIIALVIVTCFIIEFPNRVAILFSDYLSSDRMQIYKIGLHALQDNPLLGYGLNGFEPEFRLYQQDMAMEFNHAHSDLLESLLDLGIPVGLALWTAVALLLSGLWHGIRNRRQNGLFPALGLAASLMTLAHASVDFSLQIPGDVITWAALLGVGLGQSWPYAERQKST